MLKRILVVDDNSTCRDILAELFEEKYEIIHASNGLEAINALSIQLGKIEAILLDIVMPTMDGFEFLEEFNKKAWNHKVPVIIVSSADDKESRQRCHELGANYFIAKPYDVNEAITTIEKAIRDFDLLNSNLMP